MSPGDSHVALGFILITLRSFSEESERQSFILEEHFEPECSVTRNQREGRVSSGTQGPQGQMRENECCEGTMRSGSVGEARSAAQRHI